MKEYLTNNWEGLIIYLTRQPIRKVKTSRSGELKQIYISKAAYLTRTGRLYLFFKFRIETISRPTVRIIMNSSYVLISISPFRKTRNGCAAALSAAQNIGYHILSKNSSTNMQINNMHPQGDKWLIQRSEALDGEATR